MHIVGESATGKTTIVDQVGAARPYTHSLSKFTGFHSGFRQGSSTKDHSLFDALQGKMVTNKDFTTVLGMDGTSRERVFSELRDAYDGHTSSHYRNGIKSEHTDVRFSFLTAVTPEIYRFNLVHLGERFLKVQINSAWTPSGNMSQTNLAPKTVEAALTTSLLAMTGSSASSAANLVEQKSMSWGFVEYLLQVIGEHPKYITQIADNIRRRELPYLHALATIVEAARATVVGGAAHYKPKPASPNRSALQLTKLMVCLCIVYGVNAPTKKIRNICRKVALDTSLSLNEEVLCILSSVIDPSTRKFDNSGLRIGDLAEIIHTSIPTVTGVINDLTALGLVQIADAAARARGRGRPASVYQLTPELFSHFEIVREANNESGRTRE
jgi:hypothetical protein